MRLNWIKLENWRQHKEKRIDFDNKTTVIYGPNESGKSTLLEGVSRGFFDKSSSNAEVIKRIKPLSASGSISSGVNIEFVLNDKTFRVEKYFNLRKGSKLFEIVQSKDRLLAEDDSADEMLIDLLEADLPSSRGSKPSQWGAFHWLFAPQENNKLPSEKDGDPTLSLHLESEESGGLLVTPRFQYIQDIVLGEYYQYFTKTGKFSGSSSIIKIDNELQESKERYDDALFKIESVESNKQKLEDLQNQLPGLREKHKKTKEELEKARSESIDFSSIEAKLKTSEISVKEAVRDVESASKALEDIKNASKNIEDIFNKLKKTQKELPTLEALTIEIEKQLKNKKKKVQDIAMKIRDTEELTKDARILYTKEEVLKKIEELDKKADKVKKLDEKIYNLRKQEIPMAPTEEDINDAIESKMRIEFLKENLISKGLAVNIKPGNKGSLDVIIDGDKLTKDKKNATGTESITVKAKELGEVTVKGKLDKAHDAKVDIQSIKQKIQDIFSKFEVNSLDKLKEINRNQIEIKNQLKELNAERRGIDDRSQDAINVELQNLNDKYDSYKKIKRSSIAIKQNPIKTDYGELIKKREKEENEVRKALDIAREERDQIEEDATKKKEQFTKVKTGIIYLTEELEKAKKAEREIIKRYGSEENQEKILTKSNEKLRKNKIEYEKIKQRYDELEKGPMNKIRRLEQQIKNQEGIIQQQQTSVDQLKGSIATSSLDGSYSKLSEIESHIEILSERYEKENIKSEAIKLLKETIDNQYHSALSAVVGPIQEDVKKYLGYVTGYYHEDVILNEYLFPIKLGEKGITDISLEFQDGSSGLKEILTLCIRLAVAKHLCKKDSQCLVLDDPFVHVSEDRSNRMIELINEVISSHNLQVIILTHRPMEFAGLSGKTVDILAS
jgi:DNA repair exonuclease SbcCD ATPase subunit